MMAIYHPIPNGDPTVFGLPCRYPVAPSIRLEVLVQDIDHKRLFGSGRSRRKFYPEFPGAAGTGGVGATLPSFVPSAPSARVTAPRRVSSAATAVRRPPGPAP